MDKKDLCSECRHKRKNHAKTKCYGDSNSCDCNEFKDIKITTLAGNQS